MIEVQQDVICDSKENCVCLVQKARTEKREMETHCIRNYVEEVL